MAGLIASLPTDVVEPKCRCTRKHVRCQRFLLTKREQQRRNNTKAW